MQTTANVDLDRLLRALADPTRRRIFELLGVNPGMTTGEIADRVDGMTRWGVMKHIAELREAGLLQTLPQGRHRRHYREIGALGSLREWLESTGQ